MADETPQTDAYDIVLADLRAQRERIDNAIAAILALRSGGAQGDQQVTTSLGSQSATQISPGMFLGNSIVDAARQVLAIRKKPLGTPEITKALTEGGVVFSGSSPGNVVNSVLNRQSKNVGDIVSVGRGTWALASWFSNPGRFQKKKPQSVVDEPDTTGEDEA